MFYSFENPEDHRFVQDWFVECAICSDHPGSKFFAPCLVTAYPGDCSMWLWRWEFSGRGQTVGLQRDGQDIAPFMTEHCRVQQGLTIYEDDLDSFPESGRFASPPLT